MTFVTHAFFWGYVAMLVGVGASGVFIARWELIKVFGIPLEGLTKGVQATMLNQYRFLKALELGFGAFSTVFHRQIFEAATFHQLFLFVLFAGVAARLLSVLIDGRPANWLLTATAAEVITGVLVLLAGPSL